MKIVHERIDNPTPNAFSPPKEVAINTKRPEITHSDRKIKQACIWIIWPIRLQWPEPAWHLAG